MTKETKANIFATIAILSIVGSILEIIVFNSSYVLIGIAILSFIILLWIVWSLFKELFKLLF